MAITEEIKDPLTGSLSRQYLQQRLAEEADRACRYNTPFSLLVLDLDHFKSINDAFGHVRGDEVLKEFSIRIQETIRKSDLFFRYGGDEFVVILPNTTKDQAITLASRILEIIELKQFQGEPPLSLTTSIGLAAFPCDNVAPVTLFERADQRLLEAKYQGRNKIFSHDIPYKSVITIDPGARLIERENSIGFLNRFFDNLCEKKRGVLEIFGQSGCGLTRFLQEVCQQSKLRGYETVMIDLKENNGYILSRLIENFEKTQSEVPANLSSSDLLGIMKSYLLESACETFIIVLDNYELLDSESSMFIKSVIADPELSEVALIYSTKETDRETSLITSAAMFEQIVLEPLSIKGLHVWLRTILHWEPSDEFEQWLHRETRGLPVYTVRALHYLLKKGVIGKSENDTYVVTDDFNDILLGERIGLFQQSAPNNLPKNLTPFIGRHNELKAVMKILDENRLVTIVGPGGIGKTRLSIKLGYTLLRLFREGVIFVPLAALNSVEFILPTLAEACELNIQSDHDLESQIINHFGDKELLLVFDNFEHLTSGGNIISTIMGQCPNIKVLCTSRDRLNLYGEYIYKIGGLPLPPEPDDENFTTFDSVRLFLSSARRANPNFHLKAEDRTFINSICKLIDGIPLGIELAAAWVHVLSCEEIAAEIQKSQEILTTTEANVPLRHSSFKAVLEHSLELLSEEERRLFIKLSFFQGGFTRTAAEEIVGATLPQLVRLVNASLIYRLPSRRFYILEVLRKYGQDYLEGLGNEKEYIQMKHCAFYAEYLNQSYQLLEQNQAKKFLHKVNEEIDNIRKGCFIAATGINLEALQKYINGLNYYYLFSGRLLEAATLYGTFAELVESALDNRPKSETTTDQWKMLAMILFQQGFFLNKGNKLEQAKKVFFKCLTLYQIYEDKSQIANIYNCFGTLATRQRKYSEAKSFFEKSLKIIKDQNNINALMLVKNNIAHIYDMQGETLQAKKQYEENLRIAESLPDDHDKRRLIIVLQKNLGSLATDLGEWDYARRLLNKCVSSCKEMGYIVDLPAHLLSQGELELRSGQYDTAKKIFQESLDIGKDLENQDYVAVSKTALAAYYFANGNLDMAESLLSESISLLKVSSQQKSLARALLLLSKVKYEKYGLDEAKPLLEQSQEIFSGLASITGEISVQLTQAGWYRVAGEYQQSLNFGIKALKSAIALKINPITCQSLMSMAELCINFPELNKSVLEILNLSARDPAADWDTRAKGNNLLLQLGQELPTRGNLSQLIEEPGYKLDQIIGNIIAEAKKIIADKCSVNQ